jgi:hypothetical protein
LETTATYLQTNLQTAYGWSRFSVGQVLSAALLSIPPEDRPRAAEGCITDSLRALTPGPVLCTEIDLLFEPTLHLDPLMLYRRIARLMALIVLWPGQYARGVLAYAEPGHAHYRTWRRPEVRVVAIS